MAIQRASLIPKGLRGGENETGMKREKYMMFQLRVLGLHYALVTVLRSLFQKEA